MNDYVIKTSQLCKKYKIYERPVDLVTDFLFNSNKYKEFAALDKINLEVQKGEVLGFIGRNGAGKSTLLRILAGILDRTSGELFVNGRISSILELGTGFHPEYTGRENILMGGICLGMSKEEVLEKERSIIEFSELQDFIDLPFKTYSTGMQARLTFSTAMAVEPDILIVDEALSVGDLRFQLKCSDHFKRMREQGRTILLVSHDLSAVVSLCDRVILLDNGRLIVEGDPQSVTRRYYERLYSSLEKSGQISDKTGGRQLSGKLEIIDFKLSDGEGMVCPEILQRGPYVINLKIKATRDVEEISIGILIRNIKGVEIFGMNTNTVGRRLKDIKMNDVINLSCLLDLNLSNGPYFISSAVSEVERDGAFSHCDSRYDSIKFVMASDAAVTKQTIVNLSRDFSVSIERQND